MTTPNRKTCSACGREYPATRRYFHVGVRDSKGRVRSLKARCKPCTNEAARLAKLNRPAPSAAPVDLEENVWLPIGPFREWLTVKQAFYGGQTVLALRLGVSERAMYRWLFINDTVHIDKVDAALLHERSTALYDLYPELYEFEGDEEAQAA